MKGRADEPKNDWLALAADTVVEARGNGQGSGFFPPFAVAEMIVFVLIDGEPDSFSNITLIEGERLLVAV
jgi:hypothetical protein